MVLMLASAAGSPIVATVAAGAISASAAVLCAPWDAITRPDALAIDVAACVSTALAAGPAGASIHAKLGAEFIAAAIVKHISGIAVELREFARPLNRLADWLVAI
jgi:hypothetical protein